MKKLFIFILLLSSVSFTACVSRQQTTDEKVSKRQETIQSELERQAGTPVIKNATELKQVNYIYEMRDKTDLITYAYTMSALTGKWHFQYKAIGFGIPYTTQRSAPTKLVNVGINSYIWMSVPQAEPNGLYPVQSNGTWIFQISRKDGKIRLCKVEDNINVFQEPQPCDNPQDMY